MLVTMLKPRLVWMNCLIAPTHPIVTFAPGGRHHAKAKYSPPWPVTKTARVMAQSANVESTLLQDKSGLLVDIQGSTGSEMSGRDCKSQHGSGLHGLITLADDRHGPSCLYNQQQCVPSSYRSVIAHSQNINPHQTGQRRQLCQPSVAIGRSVVRHIVPTSTRLRLFERGSPDVHPLFVQVGDEQDCNQMTRAGVNIKYVHYSLVVVEMVQMTHSVVHEDCII